MASDLPLYAPDGTTDHVAGWNIMLPLKAGQTAAAAAKAFPEIINAGTRPYRAAATGGRGPGAAPAFMEIWFL